MRIMSDERPVALLFSGGKDSHMAYVRLVERGYRVCCLMTVVPADPESMLLHSVNSSLTPLQGEAMGRPVIMEMAGAGGEEDALRRLMRRAVLDYGAGYAAAGAVVSKWQSGVFSGLARESGLEPLAPLWGVDQEEYLRQVAGSGIRAIITRVSAHGLGRELLGAEIDPATAERIIALSRKYRFNPSFDGGEAETFVVDAPFYRRRISILESEVVGGLDWGELRIRRAKLEIKGGPTAAGGAGGPQGGPQGGHRQAPGQEPRRREGAEGVRPRRPEGPDPGRRQREASPGALQEARGGPEGREASPRYIDEGPRRLRPV
jgi:predicted ATP pyrophosphatase (TIGR00289 family)